MGVENVVLFNRGKMVTPAKWQAAIAVAGFELVIDTDFDPSEFSGFLPCRIGKVECGFEFFLEELDRDGVGDLETPIPDDWDTVVTLVTRSSYDDLEASCIAAAVLASLVDGGYFDGGDEPMIPGADAIAWARGAVQEIATAKKEQEEAEEARAAVLEAGDLEASLEAALGAMAGTEVRDFNKGFRSLAVIIGDDHVISGDSWRLTSQEGTYEVSRVNQVKGRQGDLLAEASGELDRKQKQQWATLERDLEEADMRDQEDLARIAEFLTPLTALRITSVEWKKPACVAIGFGGDAEFSMEYFLAGFLPKLSVRAGKVEYELTAEGVALR